MPEDYSSIANIFGSTSQIDPDALSQALTGMAIDKIMAQKYLAEKPIGNISGRIGLDPMAVLKVKQMEDTERANRMEWAARNALQLAQASKLAEGAGRANVPTPWMGEGTKTTSPKNQLMDYYQIFMKNKELEQKGSNPFQGPLGREFAAYNLKKTAPDLYSAVMGAAQTDTIPDVQRQKGIATVQGPEFLKDIKKEIDPIAVNTRAAKIGSYQEAQKQIFRETGAQLLANRYRLDKNRVIYIPREKLLNSDKLPGWYYWNGTDFQEILPYE